MHADTHPIVGRSAELQQVDELVDAIAAGPVALLLEGALGIGKTTLWRHGCDLAARRSYHVLSCRPVEW
jgi:DNA-binding NtrC family response regulator